VIPFVLGTSSNLSAGCGKMAAWALADAGTVSDNMAASRAGKIACVRVFCSGKWSKV